MATEQGRFILDGQLTQELIDALGDPVKRQALVDIFRIRDCTDYRAQLLTALSDEDSALMQKIKQVIGASGGTGTPTTPAAKRYYFNPSSTNAGYGYTPMSGSPTSGTANVYLNGRVLDSSYWLPIMGRVENVLDEYISKDTDLILNPATGVFTLAEGIDEKRINISGQISVQINGLTTYSSSSVTVLNNTKPLEMRLFLIAYGDDNLEGTDAAPNMTTLIQNGQLNGYVINVPSGAGYKNYYTQELASVTVSYDHIRNRTILTTGFSGHVTLSPNKHYPVLGSSYPGTSKFKYFRLIATRGPKIFRVNGLEDDLVLVKRVNGTGKDDIGSYIDVVELN